MHYIGDHVHARASTAELLVAVAPSQHEARPPIVPRKIPAAKTTSVLHAKTALTRRLPSTTIAGLSTADTSDIFDRAWLLLRYALVYLRQLLRQLSSYPLRRDVDLGMAKIMAESLG